MKNIYKTITLCGFVLALSACGGGGGGSSAGGGGSTMMEAPMAETDINPQLNFDGINANSRAAALSAEQQLGSVTQGSNVRNGVTFDSVGIKKAANGAPIFRILEDLDGDPVVLDGIPIIDFTVENTVAGWEGSAYRQPSGLDVAGVGFIISTTTAEFKTTYSPGDLYYVTGFWYRDTDDFGVFVDATPNTADLPNSGSATYGGAANGVFWNNNVDPNGDVLEQIIVGDVVGTLALDAQVANGEVSIGGNIRFHTIRAIDTDGFDDTLVAPGVNGAWFALNLDDIVIDPTTKGGTGGTVLGSGSGFLRVSNLTLIATPVLIY